MLLQIFCNTETEHSLHRLIHGQFGPISGDPEHTSPSVSEVGCHSPYIPSYKELGTRSLLDEHKGLSKYPMLKLS